MLRRLLILVGAVVLVMSVLFFTKPELPFTLFSSLELDPAEPLIFYVVMPIFWIYEFMVWYIIFGIHMICDALILAQIVTLTTRLECLK